jgi:xylulokinase
MGERTPHLDANARGGWIGLTASHTRGHLVRSLLEGVAYSQKDCLQIIEAMGIGVNAVRLSGGGARSAFWRQMFADVFNRRVAMLETEEGSAYGAALLAMVGTGRYSSAPEACRHAVRETSSLEPDRDRAEAYAGGHKIYQALYPALKVIE